SQGSPACGHRPLGLRIRGREIHGQHPVADEFAILHEPQGAAVRLQEEALRKLQASEPQH
ncbi:MAG: hypothetical protein ACRDTC_02500, partial [Pseudonocardiaceae bacterium]